MDPAQFMMVSSKDQESVFAKQLDACLKEFQKQLQIKSHPNNNDRNNDNDSTTVPPLILIFHDCTLQDLQVQLLTQRVYAISQVNGDPPDLHNNNNEKHHETSSYKTISHPIHLSLQNCQLDSQEEEALSSCSWETFLDLHRITHLTLVPFNPREILTTQFLHTTVAHTARHLQALHLACPSTVAHSTTTNNQQQSSFSIPHIVSSTGPTLQRLHLERLPRHDMAALVELLAQAQRGKDCPLSHISHFTLTHTTLNSDDINQLVGGLLAHRHELTYVKIGLEYCLSLTADQALPSLGLLWTEFPRLQECHVDLRHCPRLLHDQLNTTNKDPSHNYYNPQHVPTIPESIHQWGQALQASKIPHISWTMHQVGLREETVLALLPYAAKVSCSIDWRDHTLIATERFVFQLATLLPHWKGLQKMILHDLTPTELSDYSFASWWTDDNEVLLVEGLEANETIREFEFLIGGGHVPVLSPEHLHYVEEKILQRNNNYRKGRS